MTTNVATATIFIPTALRGHWRRSDPQRTGHDGRRALAQLTAEYSDLKQHLFSDEGKLRSFVNICVAGEDDIRYLNGADTELTEGAESRSSVDRRWCGRATGRRDNALQRRDHALFAAPDHAGGRALRPGGS